MRFSHFLKYNAVPEWQNHYVDYNELKNLIYTLQTDELNLTEGGASKDDKTATITGKSSPKAFAAKLKNKLFKNGVDSNVSLTENDNEIKPGLKPDEMVREETFELNDLTHNAGANTLEPTSRFSEFKKKAHDKIFESRRSSESSDAKTLFNTYDTFMNSLTVEKLKVDDFYKRMEAKFDQRFVALVKDLEKEGVSPRELNIDFFPNEDDAVPHLAADGNEVTIEREGTHDIVNDADDEDDDDDEEGDYGEFNDDAQDHTALLNYSQFNIKSQKTSLLKQSITNLYIDLCQLKSFIELNRLGFNKITKKCDKVLHLNIRDEMIQTEEFFKDTYIFQKDTTLKLSKKITQLVEFYAIITGQQTNIENCKKELKSLLHDHIVWERSNTWKDMLGLLSHNDEIATDLEGTDPNASLLAKIKLEYYSWVLPRPINLKYVTIKKLSVPKLFFTWKSFKIAFIITVTGVLLGIKTFNDPVEGRCMALVECVAFLWASEAIPLHITAFLVPLLTVLFKVLKNTDGSVMAAADASSTILAAMWSSTIMILLAGFTLGEVLSQYNVAKVVASWLLAAAGTKPRNVLLMAMGVVFFLSMWISNVAAPVLTYALLKPLLDPLDASNDFAKASFGYGCCTSCKCWWYVISYFIPSKYYLYAVPKTIWYWLGSILCCRIAYWYYSTNMLLDFDVSHI